MKKASYNKRGLVRQILNRNHNYLLTTYVRVISNKMGHSYKAYDIVGYLNKLEKQHRIHFIVKDKRIVGRFLVNAYL